MNYSDIPKSFIPHMINSKGAIERYASQLEEESVEKKTKPRSSNARHI
ncbi:MAG: hypothetical protein ACRCX2_28490 [Paraclostridium sp.]